MEKTISWFPGHMQKTIRLIKEVIKEIDLIIQIVDARAINTSANDQLIQEVANQKPILKLALKNDLALDVNNVLNGSTLDKKFKKIVIQAIEKKMQSKIKAKKDKGYVNPKIYIMVVGLPNVGKSSFINYLANNHQLITSNFPGVTRKKQWLNVSNTIAMLDTPGIFYKKIKDFNSLAILALIKTIKWEISPKFEIIEWAFNFFQNNYLKEWENYYQIQEKNFNNFLEKLCQKRKLFLKKNVIDLNRGIEILYKDIANGNICKVNYEKKQS